MHGKSLIIARPKVGAPQAAGFVPVAAEAARQAEHLKQLAAAHHYAEIAFAEDHHLVAELLRFSICWSLPVSSPGPRLAPLLEHGRQVVEKPDRQADWPWAGKLPNQLGLLLNAKAEPLVRLALKLGENSLGPDHPRTQIAAENLAILLQALSRLPPASGVEAGLCSGPEGLT